VAYIHRGRGYPAGILSRLLHLLLRQSPTLCIGSPLEMADQTPTTTWQYVTIASSTNLGPMTTPVQFPPDCTNLYDFHTTVLGQPNWSTLYTGGCAMSSCCPYSSIYTTGLAWYSSYYSPAVCPQGYQTCPGPWEVASTLPSTEHVRFCCPVYVFPLHWLSLNFFAKFQQSEGINVRCGQDMQYVKQSEPVLRQR
jgi:hypothetical protein